MLQCLYCTPNNYITRSKSNITVHCSFSMGNPSGNDTIRSMEIVFRMWKYFLLLPMFTHDRKRNQFKYEKGLKRPIFCFLVFLSSLIDLRFKYYTHKTDLELVIMRVYKVFLFCQTWITVIYVYRGVDSIEKIMDNINILDFKKKNICKGYSVSRKSWELLWILAIFLIIIILFVTDILMCNLICHSPEDVSTIFFYYLHLLVALQFQQFFVTVSFILSHHLKISNFYLKKMTTTYRTMNRIAEYDELIHITYCEFRRVFSSIILTKCVYFSCTISTTLFSQSNFVYHGDSFLLRIIYYIFLVFLVTIEVLTISVIIFGNVDIEEQTKLSIENIHDWQRRIGSENLPYKSMELVLLNSKLNKQKFYVCGLFPLDWTLIYCMVAEISTYAVFMVQFREMEQSRSSR